jgi:glycosyltransferase involved in cell wall biosynthesis
MTVHPSWFDGDWRAANARMAEPYHLADHVFWQSEFCRRAADEFLGPRRGPGEVLYNAVDVGHFAPGPAGARGRGGLTALVAGKLDAHVAYRLTDAIGGVALVRRMGLDMRLAVAGSVAPEAERQARDLAAAHGVELRFHGPYTQQAAPGIYRAADVYLMTKQDDPCPNTVLEAMACGLPVLYAASGGVPELVGDEAGVGLAIEPGVDRVATPEPRAIADGLLRLASARGAMAAAARRRAVERFDIRHWLARHEQVFKDLTGR